MVALFESNKPTPATEGTDDLAMDPAYRAWLASKPDAGEVFVDTGEASAADSRKLRWSPTRAQRQMIRRAIEGEVANINALYQEEGQEAYAERVGVLVDEALRDVGVDPATLRPLPTQSKQG
jgi:hypothetical protein